MRDQSGTDRNIADALEAVFNLVYLARITLADRDAADAYLTQAEQELKLIARHPLFSAAGSEYRDFPLH